jgi:hypothetical protein
MIECGNMITVTLNFLFGLNLVFQKNIETKNTRHPREKSQLYPRKVSTQYFLNYQKYNITWRQVDRLINKKKSQSPDLFFLGSSLEKNCVLTTHKKQKQKKTRVK